MDLVRLIAPLKSNSYIIYISKWPKEKWFETFWLSFHICRTEEHCSVKSWDTVYYFLLSFSSKVWLVLQHIKQIFCVRSLIVQSVLHKTELCGTSKAMKKPIIQQCICVYVVYLMMHVWNSLLNECVISPVWPDVLLNPSQNISSQNISFIHPSQMKLS